MCSADSGVSFPGVSPSAPRAREREPEFKPNLGEDVSAAANHSEEAQTRPEYMASLALQLLPCATVFSLPFTQVQAALHLAIRQNLPRMNEESSINTINLSYLTFELIGIYDEFCDSAGTYACDA